jgi:SAM-dependent methyltransferase
MPLIEKRTYPNNWFTSDQQFNRLYPLSMQILARRHWTPIDVAQKAASYLAADNDVKILDIGSGVGKFCLTAAHYKPEAFFYGIEQRKRLIGHAENAMYTLQTGNVTFIHGNFTQLNFAEFDHFYNFNAFYENLTGTDKIDDSIDYSGELYNYYNRYFYRQLEGKPVGTRLATYHSLEDEIPRSYYEIGSDFNNLLKFWIKV